MGNLKANMVEKNFSIDFLSKEKDEKIFLRTNEAKRFDE